MDEKKTLLSVADGSVISLSELSDKSFSYRQLGDGYAVRVKKFRRTSCGKNSFQKALYRLSKLFAPSEFVKIVSPTDGVVIYSGEYLTLRTGDGIEVSVYHETGEIFLPKTGEKVHRGDTICISKRKLIQSNRLCGAIAVILPKPKQITELQVLIGRRQAGKRAAFFKPRSNLLR